MLKKRIHVDDAKILMMGLTFKENCPDLRNTRVTDMSEEFASFGAVVDVFDPWVNTNEAKRVYGISTVEQPEQGVYDSIVLAVGHDQFKAMSAGEIRAFGKENHVLFDAKYVLKREEVDGRL